MSGRRVADFAVQKALPSLRSIDTKTTVAISALVGLGLMAFRAVNRDTMEV